MAWSVSRFPVVYGADNERTGTRWLTRWDKEVELAVKLIYYGLSVGRGGRHILCETLLFTDHISAVQTLGEEYTDVWEYSSDGRAPSRSLRAALILLPTLPSYVLARWGSHLGSVSPRMGEILKALQVCLEVATEINLAMFYLRGSYYDLVKRLLGIRCVGYCLSFRTHGDIDVDTDHSCRLSQRTLMFARRHIHYLAYSSRYASSTVSLRFCAVGLRLLRRSPLGSVHWTRRMRCSLTTDLSLPCSVPLPLSLR
jgi:hypothetical protein